MREATLAALVYQHTVNALALPCKLRLPEFDLMTAPGGGISAPDGTLPNQLQQIDPQTRAMLENGMSMRNISLLNTFYTYFSLQHTKYCTVLVQ